MHKLHLPRLGQTMKQGTILEWLKKEGQAYQVGDLLYEFESTKVAYKVEAKRPGVLARIVVKPGTEVGVGALLAVVADPGESLAEAEIQAAIAEEVTAAPAAAKVMVPAEEKAPALAASAKVKAVPKARALAEKLGLDLAKIAATGKGGAITVEDVEQAAASLEAGPRIRERRPVMGIARSMAEAVTRSWTQIPQFTQMVWADASGLKQRRLESAPEIKKTHGLDLSLNDLILEATIKAVAEAPEVNATFAGEEIIFYEDINVSFAVATEAGLIVPVLHQAKALSLADLAAKVREIAKRAREGGLEERDVQGGTITVSNLGMFGVQTGTPIITPPQAAIVFIGSLIESPVARDGRVEIRPMLGLAIAYDHRVLDGRTASRFTTALKRLIETGAEAAQPAAEPAKVSTLARRLAEETGLPLERLRGTGKRGRIMQADVLAAAKRTEAHLERASLKETIRAIAEVAAEFPQLQISLKGEEIFFRVGQG